MIATMQFLRRDSQTKDIILYYIKTNQYTLRLLSDEAKIQKRYMYETHTYKNSK